MKNKVECAGGWTTRKEWGALINIGNGKKHRYISMMVAMYHSVIGK
jgi:hypothetical protein